MNTRIAIRTTVAATLAAALSTGALAYDASTVSPSAPFGGIAVDPYANSLAEVSAQLAGLSDAEIDELIDRCDVVNHNDENYGQAVVVFCHRVLVAGGVLTTNDTGEITGNDAGDNYEDNDADPVDDNDAV